MCALAEGQIVHGDSEPFPPTYAGLHKGVELVPPPVLLCTGGGNLSPCADAHNGAEGVPLPCARAHRGWQYVPPPVA